MTRLRSSTKSAISSQAMWLGLLAAVALDTLVHLLWKQAVRNVPDSVGALQTLWLTMHQPLAYLVIALFIVQYVNWMTVLSRADLSFAQPITALSYVTIGTLSAWLFHEQLSLRWAFGVALILLGVFVISSDAHRPPFVPNGKSCP